MAEVSADAHPSVHEASEPVTADQAFPGIDDNENAQGSKEIYKMEQVDEKADSFENSPSRQSKGSRPSQGSSTWDSFASAFRQGGEPRLFDVYHMVTALGINVWGRIAIAYVLDLAISGVLGAFGVLVTVLLTKLDWEGSDRAGILVFAVIAPVYTGWNVAQYASYTIQTTGHNSIMGHLRAIVRVLPPLVLANSSGWLMAAMCVYVVPKWHLIFHALLCCLPSIVLGIFLKTYCKLKYFLDASKAIDSRRDAVTAKLTVQKSIDTSDIVCPFQQVKIPTVVKQALGPLTCFLWTVIYAFGLRALLLLAFKLPGGRLGVSQVLAQCGIFTGSLCLFYRGMLMLNKLIATANGYLAYSNKMCVAFYFIYATITNSLIRVSVVEAEGWLQWIFRIVHPMALLAFRVKAVKGFRSISKDLWKMNAMVQQGERPKGYLGLEMAASRQILSITGGLLTANVVCIIFSGLACQLEENPQMGLSLGTCPHGLMQQIVFDCLPFWTMDLVELVWLMRFEGMPNLYYFAMLDPFIVLCTLVVVYVCVCLIVLTSAISF